MNIILSENSSEPIYMQIYSQIKSQVLNGSLQAGTQLPTIRFVASELRISVIPVKRAWEELDRDGFIKTIVGKGTFVASLEQTQIESIKNKNAETLVQNFCKQAKEEGISADELLELIKKFYE